MPQELLSGLFDALHAHDYSFLLNQLPSGEATDATLPKPLRQLMVDGFLINYQVIPPCLSSVIERYNVPHVWLNIDRPVGAVRPDDTGAVAQLVEHLLGLGHRRIGYLDLGYDHVRGHGRHYSRDARCLGYTTAMAAAGLPQHRLALTCPEEQTTYAERAAMLSPWLTGPDRVTAVICYTQTQADQLLYLARDAFHLTVPADLSIASVSDQDASLHEVLTAAILPWHQVGVTAVDMLIGEIASASGDQPSRVIPMRIRPGNTCRPLSTTC